MAVRTANQRAYMVGEGEFRKSIGETFVIISRHSTSCDLCKPFEGKVLIDDVYSGGTQEDGDYMLLSQAMEQGLYHPRCRHGLGTYYPELEDINGYETEDNKLNDYSKNVDNSGENGIIYSRGGNMGISIEIDRFTPCIVERETGRTIQTRYQAVKKSDLVGLKKQGWLFNWNADDLNDTTVYKLLIEDDDSIQGLIALTDFQRSNAVYVNLAESAPHNKGAKKVYEGVGGHLFALAANESVKKGYGGFLFMDAKNMELVDYYREKFGATLLGMPHPYRMFIDEENAAKLLKIYTLKGE